MFAELVKEQRVGRVQGPLPREFLRSPAFQLAKGFPVVQNDKVRRVDNWLRSRYNETVAALDCPPYLGAPTVVAGALECSANFHPGSMHEIRHLVAPGSRTVRVRVGFARKTPPTLWSRFALPFGAVGSVWGYPRDADVVVFLTIVLLVMFAAHYVDDFFSVEQASTATGAFAVFQPLHPILGFRMKEEKSKQICKEQTLLAIEWTFDNDALFASPGPIRILSGVQR
ncbi:unnamed protein product [Symbiodinium sp. CCMP2456]|nr:unnamed protein product [Symbiodinium sp. CCMP2456]